MNQITQTRFCFQIQLPVLLFLKNHLKMQHSNRKRSRKSEESTVKRQLEKHFQQISPISSNAKRTLQFDCGESIPVVAELNNNNSGIIDETNLKSTGLYTEVITPKIRRSDTKLSTPDTENYVLSKPSFIQKLKSVPDKKDSSKTLRQNSITNFTSKTSREIRQHDDFVLDSQRNEENKDEISGPTDLESETESLSEPENEVQLSQERRKSNRFDRNKTTKTARETLSETSESSKKKIRKTSRRSSIKNNKNQVASTTTPITAYLKKASKEEIREV